MKIICSRPPNYEAIVKVFPGAALPTTIFAYAPDIYAPSVKVPPELIRHESVHIQRQLVIGVDVWWELYLTNPEFRYIEELLAHRAEYKASIATGQGRVTRRLMLKQIAKKLASPLYGKMITAEKAAKDILSENAGIENIQLGLHFKHL